MYIPLAKTYSTCAPSPNTTRQKQTGIHNASDDFMDKTYITQLMLNVQLQLCSILSRHVSELHLVILVDLLITRNFVIY